MAGITQINEAFHWNLTKIGDAFGIHRDTVKKKLTAAGLKSVGKSGNAPLYVLKDVATVLFQGSGSGGSGEINIDDLDPKSRKEWFQSENERLKFQEKIGDLIPVVNHRDGLVSPLKKTISFFDSLPDKMERRRCFTPDQLEELEVATDAFRQQLYQQLTKLKEI
jgi:hypothetical protein